MLCYLISHYQPALLPESAIRNETSLTAKPEEPANTTPNENVLDGHVVRPVLLVFSPGAIPHVCGLGVYRCRR